MTLNWLKPKQSLAKKTRLEIIMDQASNDIHIAFLSAKLQEVDKLEETVNMIIRTHMYEIGDMK